MLWIMAGSWCYKGPLPTTPGVTRTFIMSGWSHPNWTGNVFNGPTPGTAVYKGTLTPGSPSLNVTLTTEPDWWLSIDTTAFGTAFVIVA